MPPLLAQFCHQVPHLGMLSSVAEDQEVGETYCDGSICRPHYHHLHRTQHIVYGYGALSND